MLITLCYVYMWVRFHKCYSVLIRNSLSRLNSSSFSLSFSVRTSSSTPPPYGCRTAHEDSVFLQLGDKTVCVTKLQVCDDLSKWDVRLGSALIYGPLTENVAFIVEGDQVEGLFQKTSKKKVLKWSDYCLPLAYSSDQPYRVMAQATVDNFSRLGVAFIEDRLWLDNGLVPLKIVPVVLEASTLSELLGKQDPQNHKAVKSHRLCSTQSKEAVVEPSLFNGAADHQRSQCCKGSLRGSEPLQDAQDLGLAGDSEDQSSGNHQHMGQGHHLHLSSCHECLEMENSTIFSVKYASAENIPDLPNDYSVELDSRVKTQDEHQQDIGVFYCQRGRVERNNKPPNVLVYTSGCQERFQAVRQLLSECINMDNYIIYPLLPLQALSDPWLDNTKLLVVAEKKILSPELQTRFLTYLNQGGKVLGLASTLCPAGVSLEDRESQRRQISRLSFIKEDSTELELSVLASGKVYIRDPLGRGVVELWGELKKEDSHQRDMVIVKVTHGLDSGAAVLCQVHLEIAPENLASGCFDELKLSNALRYEVLTEILISLGLSCELNHTPPPGPIYLQTTSLVAKARFLKWVQSQVDRKGLLTLSKTSIKLVSCSELRDGSLLPKGSLALITDSSESWSCLEFCMETYKKNLRTSLLGHTLLFAEIITSTMDLLEGMTLQFPKDMGLIAVAGQQSQGRGRGKNTWLSPRGCAMFTLKVEVELSSRLGRRISFLQHLVALAVVEAVCTLPGYQDIDLKVKWPNDIYYSNLMKLGGVLVTSTVQLSTFHLLIGCGVNVTNSNPTVCINDVIQQYNIRHNCSLQPLSCAQLIARTVNCLETLINRFQQGGPDTILPTYYKRWLHGGAKVHLWSENGPEAEVVGLDLNGFLQVHSKEHGIVSVEPDGNSFDMLKNLVIIKQH